ncbi:MAG: hypothetical protein WBG80_12480, partial [Bacteroidota bacterium]
SAFIEIKYQRGTPEKEVRELLEFLQRDREAITAELGFESEKKITVKIYTTVGQFRSDAKVKENWREVVFSRGTLHVQPLELLLEEGTLDRTMSYELALAILEDAWSLGCPQWLREAYAVYHSGMLESLTPPIGVRHTSFADLDQDLQEHTKPPQLDDVHYVLGQTMLFFIKGYGAAKAFGVYAAFDGNQAVEKVFEKVFEEEYAEIEKKWASTIRTDAFPTEQ